MRSLSRFLADAEQRIGLLERCRPTNARAEIERVSEEWERGREASPAFVYGAPRDLAHVRRGLESAACAATCALEGELLAGRAEELLVEVELALSVGTARVRDLAPARFPLPRDGWAAAALADAERFVALAEDPPGRTVLAEDRSDPESLVSILSELVGSRKLALRVETTPELSSSAATGTGFVRIREGVRHGPAAARRIALHEVVAHAEPRLAALREPSGVFVAGTRGSSADEEGRAILVEERAALLDSSRKRELGARHLAALAVRDGAEFVDVGRLLVERGIPARRAVAIAARVLRGGGLAREVVYLPAWHRVRAALEEDPSLEAWLARGRLSIDAARALRVAAAQENVATTGV
ncbi:MAG TPA: tyrosine/phenylalanine carboxypeptidase domain-containing protein [Polyangiaceae bacterium]|nr:tyrosine/phenylalanine carboxypeptidase domain-containing protein [Polyangiaceae bacterium]